MTTKVSILIPCYNAHSWIAAAIESALQQTHANTEVIVVDDGSTDGSLDVIKSFGDKIHWVTGPNRGGNVARNQLLELATGEWLQYLDADDYLLPTKIEQQLSEIGDAESDVAYAPIVMEHVAADGSCWREDLAISPEDDPWILLIRWELPQTGGPLWRRSALVDVGRWNEQQECCQEHELYFRLLAAGKRFTRCQSVGAVYRLWTQDSVCRRDPLTTNLRRMEIVDRCEQHLQDNNQLTANHRVEIAGQRLQIARSIYPQHRDQALQLAARARGVDGTVDVLSGPAFPPSYRVAYRYFGFQAAEWIAGMARPLRTLLGKS